MSIREYARRMIRTRNWHLMQANAAQRAAGQHDAMAASLERQLRALGFEPQPPAGPEVA